MESTLCKTVTIHAVSPRLALSLSFVLFGFFPALAQTNQLTQLLSTNRAGQYRLTPAWVGERRQAVATGFFATHTNLPGQQPFECDVYFDLFSYFDKRTAMPAGSRVISQSLDQTKDGSRETSLHVHRASFPTDAELAGAHTLGALANLLGPIWGPRDAWGLGDAIMHSHASWACFRLKDDDTLETLSVSCSTTHTVGQPEQVESIRIRRGTAKPAK